MLISMNEAHKQLQNIGQSHMVLHSLPKKTQVMGPLKGKGLKNFKNRYTHSIEVSEGATQILLNLNITEEQKMRYLFIVRSVAMLHDSGHSPFGHDGQKILDSFIKDKGLNEGFDDNNNNLVVIEKSGIQIDSYIKASVIKYPNRLYSYQKDYHINMLEKSIEDDMKIFSQFEITNKPVRTFACEVMDVADENAYLTSDLADAIVGGIIKKKIILKELDTIMTTLNNKKLLRQVYSLKTAIEMDDKSSIRFSLLGIQELLNLNYYLNSDFKLTAIDEELNSFKKVLYVMDRDLYINNKSLKKDREKEIKIFKEFLDYVYENKIFLSKTYQKRYESTNSDIERLRIFRDMIAEKDDIYIFKKHKNLIKF